MKEYRNIIIQPFTGWAWLKHAVTLRVKAKFGRVVQEYSVSVGYRDFALIQFSGTVIELRSDTEKMTVDPLSRKQAAIRICRLLLVRMAQNPSVALSFFADLFRATVRYRSAGVFSVARYYVNRFLLVKNEYSIWADNFDTPNEKDTDAIRHHAQRLDYRPKFSILMPVYNTQEKYLRKAIDSVLAQSYDNWELCIADDASTYSNVRSTINNYLSNGRIHATFREQNGHISEASNTTLSMATGEFIVLLDHDDELAPHALYYIATKLNKERELDLIYTDSDKIDSDGRRFDPHFKSSWNPDLFLSFNLITHLCCLRTDRVRKIGGFRKGYEGSQDYDLFLRFIGETSQIAHIPRILYHWRSIEGSTALGSQAKRYAIDNARRAIGEFLESKGISGNVVGAGRDYHRVVYSLPTLLPKVSIIICTRDKVNLLKDLISDLFEKTNYPSLEIVIVDNQSREPETRAYFDSLRLDKRVRIISYDQSFNYSAMNNLAANQATGEIIALLNNDLRVIGKDWLKEMVRLAVLKDVAAVGAKLLYPDNLIQHVGIILGMGGIAGHPLRHYSAESSRFVGRANAIQAYSAVTGACLVIRKSIFLECGGFDEKNLPVAFNDVDLCLRLMEKGYRNIYTPFAKLYHLESASRPADETPANSERFRRENEYMYKRWGKKLQEDPYYNPNLSLLDEACRPAFPPRVHPTWEE